MILGDQAHLKEGMGEKAIVFLYHIAFESIDTLFATKVDLKLDRNYSLVLDLLLSQGLTNPSLKKENHPF